MTQELSTPADRVLEVLVNGNLSVLTPNERVDYYNRVCGSLGLNPMTSPFAFITLNNKLTLYATKACTDQLRQIHGVSVSEPHISQIGDMYSVAVTATDRSGRQDSDMGIVTVKGLTGENLANAMLKAVTKAKRRVTLSICGLGMLDETEIEDIPASAKRPPVVMPQPRMEPPSVDSSTGEILNRPALAAPRSKQEVAAPVSAPTGEIPFVWTEADLNTVLKAKAIALADLSGVLGAACNKETFPDLIDPWLRAHPGSTLEDLANAAVAFHMTGGAQQPALA